ncbi:hypothetical protein GGS24DRAFT_515126 [Hypoxylon argillaceum]|nr:hypothetical protein GGS24DRAFT_515126 [Hypoxylon argillaceum]
MAENRFLKKVLRGEAKRRLLNLVDIQKIIPYHIDMLSRQDHRLRDDYSIVQKWYEKALNLSIEEIREYMYEVELHELEGFAVPPITEKPKHDDGNYKGGIDPQPHIEFANPPDSADVSTADTPGPLDSDGSSGNPGSYDGCGWCGESETSTEEELPAPRVVGELSEQEAHHAQQRPPDAAKYDDDGFYIEEVPEVGTAMGEGDSRSSPSSSSWADEVEDAIAQGVLRPIDSPTTTPTPSAPPRSEELRNLIEAAGGDPDTARSGHTPILDEWEFLDGYEAWMRISTAMKEWHARRHPNRHYLETWQETDLLDSWDEDYRQFYWQTEALFLCRLTELVYKETFEEARAAAHAKYKVPASKKQRNLRWRKPAGSSLRNEVSL